MSYKIRNTIALAVLFVLTAGGGGFWWGYWQPKELGALQTEIDKIEKELVNLPALVAEVEQLTVRYQDVRRKYDSRSKIIPASDLSSETYEYISQGIDEAGFLKFGFEFGQPVARGDYSYNTYQISEGETDFGTLYKFIYFLENGRRLYKVSSLTMDVREELDAETGETGRKILFSMGLQSFFSKVPELGQSLAATALPLTPPPYDPFNPVILQVLATEAPAGEIDASRVEVKAVLPGKAYVLTSTGIVILHLGDKVWRGYVSRISPAESKVEFTVNEGGIIRTIEKKIDFVTKK
ncbi:MAG: hypothetical protein L0Y80_03115 [Ignavibacteriae bacterium]|nr:hypothetical protein [Ignavibacteriota bacterium]